MSKNEILAFFKRQPERKAAYLRFMAQAESAEPGYYLSPNEYARAVTNAVNMALCNVEGWEPIFGRLPGGTANAVAAVLDPG